MRNRSWRLPILCIALLPGLAACSLLTIRTPDKPLPQRELNARMLTREFATSFAAKVEVAADGIAAGSTDPALQLNALRWKLGASRASQHAATQMAPMMALLDTWALSEQMQQFFATGAGANLFGTQQNTVRAVAEQLAASAQRLARGTIVGSELGRYQSFVERYVREQPLVDLSFARASVVDQWVAETGEQATFIDSVGTVAQSMSDVSDRMRMFGERVPTQAVWQARLAIGESDLGHADFVNALAQAEDSLERLTRLAESSPAELQSGIANVRGSLLAVSNRFDASWLQMLRSVREEREALAANIRDQREFAVEAFDVQRAAVAKDASRIANQAIASGSAQIRGLVREAMIFGILLIVLIMVVPFAGGYFVGRLVTRARA